MFQIIKSKIDPHFVEVWEGGQCIEEIRAPFLFFCRRKFPTFASLDALKKWVQQSEEKMALARAKWLLGQRSYASKRLLQKLLERGFSEQVSEKVVEAMQRCGIVCDEEHAKRLAAQGMGPRKIAWKMQSETRGEWASEESQKEQIASLLVKLKGTREQKIRALLRRGFEPSPIFAALGGQ